jgi:hypothetical protein
VSRQAISQRAGDGHVALGVARLKRADHKTLTAAAAHALTHLYVWSLAVKRERAAFEYEQLRAPQSCRGEHLEHEPVYWRRVLIPADRVPGSRSRNP